MPGQDFCKITHDSFIELGPDMAVNHRIIVRSPRGGFQIPQVSETLLCPGSPGICADPSGTGTGTTQASIFLAEGVYRCGRGGRIMDVRTCALTFPASSSCPQGDIL